MTKVYSLRIGHYRSIRDPITIQFPPNCPLVLVGENNSGKSNVVRAMELVMGAYWPGSHEPEDNEFHGRKRSNPIEIQVEFDGAEPLGRFASVRWFYDHTGDHATFDGTFPSGAPGYVKTEDRENCVCVVLEADRKLSYHLSYSSKSTYLSQLMRSFHRELTGQQDLVTSLQDLFEQVRSKFEQVPAFNTFRSELKTQVEELSASMPHRLEIDFSAYNPVNFFHALRLSPREGTETRGIEELGTGEQQILALALVYAYGKAFHGGILLIVEEPEVHLHPLAQTWLARKMGEMSRAGLQVVITTHSPTFVNLLALEGLVLLRKVDGATTVAQLNAADLARKCIAMGASEARTTATSVLPFYYSNSTNDVLSGLFSRRLILVEGGTEGFALPVYFQKAGFDPVKEGVAIVPVLGKGNLAKWYRFYKAYGIPTYVAFDNDQEDDERVLKRTDVLKALGIDPGRFLPLTSSTDWLVESTFTVFGKDFESSLKAAFPEYSDLERDVKASGVDAKPLVARQVALRVRADGGQNGWAKISRMIEAISHIGV